MNTATVTLSEDAEARLVFWASPMDSIYPASMIAAVTGIAANTLTNMRVSGEGPAFIKRGGRVYYRKDAVVMWLDSSRQPTAAQGLRSAASANAAA